MNDNVALASSRFDHPLRSVFLSREVSARAQPLQHVLVPRRHHNSAFFYKYALLCADSLVDYFRSGNSL